MVANACSSPKNWHHRFLIHPQIATKTIWEHIQANWEMNQREIMTPKVIFQLTLVVTAIMPLKIT